MAQGIELKSSLARRSREALVHAGPPLLARALTLLDGIATEGLAKDQLWIAAGAGGAMAALFQEAQRISGRTVCDLIFALHERLSGTSQTAPWPAGLKSQSHFERYSPWLEGLAREASPWRGVLLRWVDSFSERLTLHRYSGREHRRRHARDLLAHPLKLALADGTLTAAEETALLDFCELTLAFWDLVQAQEQGAHGWNRIELPGNDRIGGFYGLADAARPPDASAIRQAVTNLQNLFQSIETDIPPALSPWLDVLTREMLAALQSHSKTARWPAWTIRTAKRGLWLWFQQLTRRG